MVLTLPRYTLIVDAQSLALVLNTLDELPGKTSRGLVNHIESQADAQHRASEPKPSSMPGVEVIEG